MILVTGQRGFIGAYLCRYLREKQIEFTPFPCNITRAEDFPDIEPTAILHLAARVDKIYWDSPQLDQTNILGTQQLLEHYPEAKMIFFSSADIESADLSPYARSKKQAEDFVLQDPKNLSIRPPSIIGPNDHHNKLVPNLFRSQLLGADCKVSEGPPREYQTIDDLCEQTVEAIPHQTGIVRLKGFHLNNLEMQELVIQACGIASGSIPMPANASKRLKQFVSYAKEWKTR